MLLLVCSVATTGAIWYLIDEGLLPFPIPPPPEPIPRSQKVVVKARNQFGVMLDDVVIAVKGRGLDLKTTTSTSKEVYVFLYVKTTYSITVSKSVDLESKTVNCYLDDGTVVMLLIEIIVQPMGLDLVGSVSFQYAI